MRVLEKFYPSKKNDPITITHFEQSMKRFHHCDNKKDASQIKKEIRACKKYWKCYPYHYYIHDLFRKDKPLSEEELVNFIPHYYYYYLFLPHYAPAPKFSLIADNKLFTDQIFRALNIAKPETICSLYNGALYTPDMHPCSFGDIIQHLSGNEYEKIFVKPAEGSGGKGIQIFHRTEDGHYETRQKQRFDNPFLATIGKKSDYVIEPGIVQDGEMSKIFSLSVNTCRIITENRNGKVRLVCAILRMGQGQNEVDNISSGGICTNIDITSGKFGDFAISYNGEKITTHPDTQYAFSHQGISRWNEIVFYLTESAGKLPFFTYVGWDIALTRDGPVTIEINKSPAIDIMEDTSWGLREAFGIDDPDYYWKNPGNRM